MTRFLVLMTQPDHFDKWDAGDEAYHQAIFDDFRAFLAAVRERGEVSGGEALVPPSAARTLRPGASAIDRPVTEGPYAETVEQLGGFYLVDLPDLATAVELAALLPLEYSVEVRECLDVDATG